MADKRLGHLHGPDHIEAMHALPVSEIGIAKLAKRTALPGKTACAHGARRIDEHVDGFGRKGCCQRIDRGVILDVERVDGHPAGGLFCQLLQFRRTLRTAHAGEHAPAVSRILPYELETNAARGACDQYGGQESSPWTSNEPSIYASHPAPTNPHRLATTL